MKYVSLAFILIFSNFAWSNGSETYLPNDAQLFSYSSDTDDRAEGWATCSSAFLVTTDILGSDMSLSDKESIVVYVDDAAKAAVIIYFHSGWHEGMSESQRKNLWSFSKSKSKAIAARKKVEMTSYHDKNAGIDKILKTYKYCRMNEANLKIAVKFYWKFFEIGFIDGM